MGLAWTASVDDKQCGTYLWTEGAYHDLCLVFDESDLRLPVLRSLRIDRKTHLHCEDLCAVAKCTGGLKDIEMAIDSGNVRALDGFELLSTRNSQICTVKIHLDGLWVYLSLENDLSSWMMTTGMFYGSCLLRTEARRITDLSTILSGRHWCTSSRCIMPMSHKNPNVQKDQK